MLENIWFVAAIWMGLALIASIISIRLGVSVALIEILIGVLAGNFLGIHKTTEWINFLAMLGSGVLTFLAGAEIDPVSLYNRKFILSASFYFYLAFCPICFRLESSPGSNSWNIVIYNLRCGCICCFNRKRLKQYCPW
jgi:Kef-type K+ transport system membrane component KefB